MTGIKGVRDHLLEILKRALDVGARRNIVLDAVDERGVGDASSIGGRVLGTGVSGQL